MRNSDLATPVEIKCQKLQDNATEKLALKLDKKKEKRGLGSYWLFAHDLHDEEEP